MVLGTCSVLVASLVTVATVNGPSFHTVESFDNTVRVTQTVLDRTYCPRVEKIHPLTTANGVERVEARIKQTRQKQIEAGQAHCKARLRRENKPESECALQK